MHVWFVTTPVQTPIVQALGVVLEDSTIWPEPSRWVGCVCWCVVGLHTPFAGSLSGGLLVQLKVVWSLVSRLSAVLCRFDPERFSPAESRQRHPLAFVPFGFAGKRKCPGYLFTYAEVGTFLIILLRRYKVSIVTKGPVEKVYGLITSPKDEIFAKLDLRGDGEE